MSENPDFSSYRDTTFDIDDKFMGIRKNESGIYWRVPNAWNNPTSGVWIYWGSDDSLLSRGKPSFLVIIVSRQWRRPTEWSFDDITFRNFDETTLTFITITSGFNWSMTILPVLLGVYLVRKKKRRK